MAESDPNPDASVPGGTVAAHPRDAIPLPRHGFGTLDDVPVRASATVPAAEVVREAAVLLMSACADRLGLHPDGEPQLDLDEARTLITALAGLVAASHDQLGPHRGPLRDGVRTLQKAFRETSARPDAPGEGPGEKYLL